MTMNMSGAWRKNPELRQQHLTEQAKESGYKAGKLAKLCGTSLRTVERYCRDDFGCELRVWLKRLRMAAAPDLLREHGNVGKASRKLDYRFPTNFARDFIKAHGIAPTEFLKRGDFPRDVAS